MHILTLSHLYPPMRIGGIEKIAQIVAESFVKNGNKVSVVTGNFKNFRRSSAKSTFNGVEIYTSEYINFNYPNQFITEHLFVNFKLIELSLKIIKEEKIDWIYAHDWFISPAAELLQSLTNIPLISTIHYSKYHEQLGRETDNGNFIVELQKRLIEKSYKTSVYSSKMVENINDIVSNKIKCHYFPIGFSDLMPKFNLKSHQKRLNRVVLIGRLAKEKNFSTVLHSISLLKKEYRDIIVDIIGDGYLLEELKMLADKLNIMVKFHGFIEDFDDIKTILKSAKTLILPSYYDSFGLVVLESLFSQTPVIISENVGAKEISNAFQNYTFCPDDYVDLASKIKKVLKSDQELQIDMEQIREEVNRKYTHESMWLHLKEIFK